MFEERFQPTLHLGFDTGSIHHKFLAATGGSSNDKLSLCLPCLKMQK